MEPGSLSAWELAQSVREGDLSALEVVRTALDRVERLNPSINAFTQVTRERALAEAEAVDRSRSLGSYLGPLAGVPYAVKNLFDLKDVVTLAGSAVLRGRAPASEDAVLVERLCKAGAICVGALSMDEFAYGFTTENSHYGPCRNPHDPTRIAGGSSGGSAAAVAAGLVPLALGSDTNGSIRVPASLCGVFGLKPTFGRLPRRGAFPFVAGLDHLGPFARNTQDLALAYDTCQGQDQTDPACAQRPVETTLGELHKGLEGLRVARLTGYFDAHATPAAQQASRAVSRALGANEEIVLPDAAIARAAAFILTAAEGGALHLPLLRHHYEEYEPLSRDRFVSGALTPAAWYLKAQRFRTLFQRKVLELFQHFDVLVAPATPCPAPLIGTEWLEINGKSFPARASMGLLTQPISFIGLPVAVVPVTGSRSLPLGVQIIAAPWREDLALRAAAYLESIGLATAPIAEVKP